jgi:drug/metabolite transporter (DMT)-like permease
MISSKIKSDLILLLAAIIWGFAFVAQRVGMDYVGPFTFNGIRFTLGVLVIIPFLVIRKKSSIPKKLSANDRNVLIIGSLITGLLLFGGASLQQVGLQTTTAGKAGFLTGLYVVFVPLIGIFFHHKSGIFVWLGVILSGVGLYFLSITSNFSVDHGDLLVLACALVYSCHVLMISWLSPKMDSYKLAAFQFAVCGILSLVFAFFTETIKIHTILEAWLPIAYGGVLSVGGAYTLQVIAQKKAHPAHASIILSLEAVFAALGGWLILNEHLTNRSLFGCFLMLVGMIVVQVYPEKKKLPPVP